MNRRLPGTLLFVLFLAAAAPLFGERPEAADRFDVREDRDAVAIAAREYTLHIWKDGFRYGFRRPNGDVIVEAHPRSGIQIGHTGRPIYDVAGVQFYARDEDRLKFRVTTENGIQATVSLWIDTYGVRMGVRPEDEGEYTIVARTRGVSPAYGLADHAVLGAASNRGETVTVELTGFEMDPLRGNRTISNFVIFPRDGFAMVNIEPGEKIVRLTVEENLHGSKGVRSMPSLYHFAGSPREIYKSFLEAREREGFPVYRPKHDMFGVGWESFGALAWKTNQETVTDNINTYLDLGFPLDWMVVGSGFWPRGDDEFDEHGLPSGAETADEEAKKLMATTSFGMWDERLYPDPKGMIDHFRKRGIKTILGLRIAFIPGGPFTDEGLENRYFIENEQGEARLFTVGFPKPNVYLLNAHKPEAVKWYVDLCQKWLDYGVAGFKEDLFGYPDWLPSDFIDPVNRALMDRGVYTIGRNNYLGSPMDLHRFNGIYYNRNQDTGPVNGLAFAYSGLPYVYPDIVGGAGLATQRFGDQSTERLRLYLMRYAEYAALNPSMSFGYGPWNFDEEVVRVARGAALLHKRLQPYIYSNAVKAYKTGFPYTMTPLSLAYPSDPEVYGLANSSRRGYQWLIGDSLLATPLYGDDYATANSRDVYLPKGAWIEYDSGNIHRGPATLKDFPLPVGKTPLFVGGTGIVVEVIGAELRARIYPVAEESSMHFYGRDGEIRNRIAIVNPDWSAPTVFDETNDDRIPGEWNRHAYEFVLAPGHDYRVE